MQRLQQLQRELGFQPQFGFTGGVPAFSTQPAPPTAAQTHSAQTQPAQTQPESSGPKKRNHNKKGKDVARETQNKTFWTSQEEVWLATCWIDTSEDPIVGNSQRRATLWGTVARKFNENEYGWKRNEDALSSKWRTLDKACKAFQGCWEDEQRNPRRSGRNEEDDYNRAVALYVQRENRNWMHKEAWRYLMDKPKWFTPRQVGGGVIGRETEVEVEVPTGTVDLTAMQVPERPIGRERAKKVARSGPSSDAATSSRSSNSSKFEELAEEANLYKKEVAAKQIELMEAHKRKEKFEAAMNAAKWLADIDLSLEQRNPKAFRRLQMLEKELVEEYGDLLKLPEERVQNEDEDEDDDE